MQATLPSPVITSGYPIERQWHYLVSLVPGLLAITGNWLGGPWVWLNLAYTFGIGATVELFVRDRRNGHLEDATLPNLVLITHVALQLGVLTSLLYGATTGLLQGWMLVGAVLSTGAQTGSGAIVVAHEMGHRQGKAWRLGANFLLLTAGNPYFLMAHLRTHHLLVGTSEDSATARRGEVLYSFVVRSIAGQVVDSLRHEAQRLRKAGRRPYTLDNYLLGMTTLWVAVNAAIYLLMGPRAVVAFIGQGLVANFLLEYINYIEHYGLVRASRMVRVDETHAWQSNHLTRYTLVDLTRHPDHHRNGAKPYHKLQQYETSPELPTGYAGMIYLALVPPLFFQVMHRRLAAYQAKIGTTA